MNRRAVLLLLLLAACRREMPAGAAKRPALPPPEQYPIVEALHDEDADNLLDVAYGASVVERSGEANLVSSAAHAIDGMAFSAWISPPGGGTQILTFALPAPSHIRRLGIIPPPSDANVPQEVRFETSLDGRRWERAAGISAAAGTTPQLVDIGGVDARFVRVSVVEPAKYYTHLHSILATGQETGPPSAPRLDGCWTINDDPARFELEGNHLTGRVGGRIDAAVEGAVDDRVARVMWMHGPTWGYALLTTTPDGDRLTGISWFEDANATDLAPAWFGQRVARCDLAPTDALATATALLDRAGHWSMFGLSFGTDDRLLPAQSGPTLRLLAQLLAREPSHRFRVVAHEFRSADAKENQRRTAARIDSLRAALQSAGVDASRIELVPAGSAPIGSPVVYAPQRVLASRVDLERSR